jgi:hypothetical protein
MEKRTQTTSRRTQVQSAPDEMRRVIVRFSNGSMLRGYFTAEDVESLRDNPSETFGVRRLDGEIEHVQLESIKAIFLVKSFEGSRHYSEFKVFTNQPNGNGVWIRVHFHDGEVMEGIAPNSLDTYTRPVFSLTPPDPRSNNETVLVSKQCLQQMQILGLASD